MPYCARCKESVEYIDGNGLCDDCYDQEIMDDLEDEEWDD